MGSLNAKVGDEFWTMLDRISRSGKVLAPGPYTTKHIYLSRENVDEMLSIDLPPTPVKADTVIGKAEIKEAAYIQVTRIEGGNVYAKVLPREQWPDACPRNCPAFDDPEFNTEGETTAGDFFQSERDEPIEWRGTEQTISGDDVETRSDVFSESDVRGEYNDLL